MQRTETYQDVFLNQARRERTPLTVFLVNGFQMRGVITGFDPFVIVLFSEGRQQMIYKHAVSTITPSAARRISWAVQAVLWLFSLSPSLPQSSVSWFPRKQRSISL